MIDGVLIENIMRQWVVDVTALEVIIANQVASGPRPSNPYATIQLTDFQQMQLNEVSYEPVLGDDTKVEETVTVRPTVIVSVNMFGEEAKVEMFKLLASQWQRPTIELFQNNDLGLVSFSLIRNLPRLTDSNWETRLQTDVTFNLIGRYVSEIDVVSEIEYENTDTGEIITIDDVP